MTLRRILAGCLAVLVAASISSCFLISATGVYDFTNETNNPVRVIWKGLHDGETFTFVFTTP